MYQTTISFSKKSKKTKSPILLDIIEELKKPNDYTIIRNNFGSSEYFP